MCQNYNGSGFKRARGRRLRTIVASRPHAGLQLQILILMHKPKASPRQQQHCSALAARRYAETYAETPGPQHHDSSERGGHLVPAQSAF